MREMKSATEKPPDPGNEKAALAGGSLKTLNYNHISQQERTVNRPGISPGFLARHNIRHIDEVQAEAMIGYQAGGDKEDKTQIVNDPLEDCIILPSRPVGILEAAERLFQMLARSETLFLRGGRVFELIRADDGVLRLEVITEDAFRSRIERHGKVMAYRASPHGGHLLKADARCSKDNATALLASDAKNVLPPIAAVHSCPIITETENGIEVLGKSYHGICGGRLVTGGAIPEQKTLSEAVEILLDSIAEYDFATPADKSRAIGAILTPALKSSGLLEVHTPLFVVEADDSQAGKGFFFE